eukprot:6213797-Pleurochrysis_carterae.AAC.7
MACFRLTLCADHTTELGPVPTKFSIKHFWGKQSVQDVVCTVLMFRSREVVSSELMCTFVSNRCMLPAQTCRIANVLGYDIVARERSTS